ncbi:MAG: sulfur carrier protein ThiS [Phycisphaerae bacterium]|nr:sulfur carrier protein ThiS [Phycisphaerae bacterium]
MRINVNGQWQERPDALTVAELLSAMGLDPRRVAVERNRQIVRRADHAATRLAHEDTLEIVTLVGGG